MQERPLKTTLAVLRFAVALQFLWAFFDRLFGLGFSTAAENAWIRSGSPTAGFLTVGSTGLLVEFYNLIGGKAVTDWLYMLALLLIGITLLLGIGMKIATISGSVLMFLMWSATLPKTNNLFQIDQHIIYIVVLLVLLFSKADQYAGLGSMWANTKLVRRATMLE